MGLSRHIDTLRKNETLLLAIAFVIPIVGIMFRYQIPVFAPYTLLLFLYLSLLKKKIKVIRSLYFYLLIAIPFVSGVLLSGITDYLVQRDLFNLISIATLAVCFSSIVSTKEQLLNFKLHFFKIALYATVAIASIGIIKFILQTKGIEIPYFKTEKGYPWGTALISDFNYYALGNLIGLVIGLNLLKDALSKKEKLVIIIGTIMLTTNVVFAGSRRGIIFLFLILAVSLTYYIIKRIRYHFFINKKKTITVSVIAIVLTMVAASTMISERATIVSSIAEYSGANPQTLKSNLTIITYRYRTLLNSEGNIHEYYEKLWGESSVIDETKLYKSLNSKGVKSRAVRWDFALEIYKNQYGLTEKTIGNGFNYIQLYTSRFHWVGKSDYPHNPILSALLYGGAIGALSLILFLIISLKIMWRNRKDEAIFLTLLIMTLIYTLVSGNSFFSVKLLVIFSLFPFLINPIISSQK